MEDVVEQSPVLVPVGRMYLTSAVQFALEDNSLSAEFFGDCLDRHMRGDWGDMDDEDQQINADSLPHGARVMSSYPLPQRIDGDDRLWIMSEGGFVSVGRERVYAQTTILFPSDY